MRVTRDHTHDNSTNTNTLKTPRTRISKIGSQQGYIGNIILDLPSKIFHGHTGIEWVPFHGGADVTLQDVDITGPGVSLIGNGIGPNLTVKKLESGVGVLITDNGDRLTIDSFGGGGAPNNAQYVVLSLDPTLTQERVLTAGVGVSITDGGANANVTIDSTITLTSTGVGESLVNTGTVPTFIVKGLTAGTDVSLTDNGTNITINAEGASSVALNSAGGDVSLVTDGIGPDLEVKGLTAGTGITLDDTSGTDIVISTNITSGYTRTVVNSDYSIIVTDDIIAVQNTTLPPVPVTLTLPLISGLGTPSNYKKYTIVDEGGNAGVYQINVVASVGDTILGQNSLSINQDYNSITVYSDGTSAWYVI